MKTCKGIEDLIAELSRPYDEAYTNGFHMVYGETQRLTTNASV